MKLPATPHAALPLYRLIPEAAFWTKVKDCRTTSQKRGRWLRVMSVADHRQEWVLGFSCHTWRCARELWRELGWSTVKRKLPSGFHLVIAFLDPGAGHRSYHLLVAPRTVPVPRGAVRYDPGPCSLLGQRRRRRSRSDSTDAQAHARANSLVLGLAIGGMLPSSAPKAR